MFILTPNLCGPMAFEIKRIPLSRLKVSPTNVRIRVDESAVRKLMLNIMQHGLLQPLVVRPEGDTYGIVCGRLRYEAIKLMKTESPSDYERLFSEGIPCVVRELPDKEATILSLSENVRQNTMTPEEVGAALARLREEYGLSYDEMMRELQIHVDEIKRVVSLWRSLKKATEVGVPSGRARPGRPRKSAKKRRVTLTGMVALHSLARSLKEAGYVEDEDKFVKELGGLVKGMSTREIQALSEKLRLRPEIVTSREELRRVVEEMKSKDMVERVVLLKRSVAEKIRQMAYIEKKSFDEELNEILEMGLRHKESVKASS